MSDPPRGEAAAAATSDDASGRDRWTARSSGSGTSVRLVPPSKPIEAGTVRFRIEVDGPEGAEPTSIDLASPTMPMHGILRFPVQDNDAGSGWVAEPEIPMEGLWALYVNLDQGSDAAAFEFDVEPGAGGGHHHHGSGEEEDGEDASDSDAHERSTHEHAGPESDEHDGHERGAAHGDLNPREATQWLGSAVSGGSDTPGARSAPSSAPESDEARSYFENPGLPGPRGEHVTG